MNIIQDTGRKNGQYELKNKFKNQCWRMWSSCVVTVNGEIVPCCFDKDAKYQLGKLKSKSLKKQYGRVKIILISDLEF